MSEVASAYVSLIPSFKGGQKAISRELDGAADTAGRSSGKKAGRGFSGSFVGGLKGIAGPMAAAFGIAAVGSYLKGAVAGASDLSEATSKVGVVFGKQAAQIVAASEKSAKAMGLSKNAYLDATGSLGNLLVSLKIAPKAAAGMSQQMVKLAGDLASFNNVSPEEALAALQSGLTGETEPLKRFGVNMNDATLKAQALKMGLIKTTKEALTPQNKALAAQALIMDQTKTAQGDFARTSGGLANQQRILAAQMEDTKAKVGGFLLPIVTKFVTFLNGSAIPKVMEFAKGIGGVFSILAKGDFKGASATFGLSEDSGVVDFLFKVRDGIASVVKFFDVLRQSFRKSVTDTSGLSSGFSTIAITIGRFARIAIPFLKTIFDVIRGGAKDTSGMTSSVALLAIRIGVVLRNAIALAVQAFRTVVAFIQTQVVPRLLSIGQAVQAFVAVALPIVQAFVAGMMARIRPMMPQIRAIFGTIGSIITGVMDLVKAVISRVTTVISYIWARWGKNIMDFVSTAFRNILTVIGGALKIIQGIIKVATSIFKGDWAGAWAGIKQIVAGAWQVIKGVVSTALHALGGIIKGSGALLGAAMSAVGDKINGALDGLRDKMLNAGKELIQNLIDGIKAKIGAVKDAAKNVAQAVKDFFPGSPVRRGPLTSWNNGGAGRRLGDQLAYGLTASQSTVAAASRGLASSVAAPVGSPALAGGGAGGGSMSQADILRLAAAMGNVQLQTTVSAGSFDRQMGARL